MTAVSVVIPAGGSGSRFDSHTRKQFLMHEGWPLLRWSIEPFTCLGPILENLVIVLPENEKAPKNLCLEDLDCQIHFTGGGPRRQDSIYNGLKYLKRKKADGIWLVHDAARPLLKEEDIKNLISTINKYQCGALLASPIQETVKEDNGHTAVKKTLNRDRLWLAHTPQGAPSDLLWQAYENALKNDLVVTDDASMLEALNIKVKLVESSCPNIKVTTPYDWLLCRHLLNRD